MLGIKKTRTTPLHPQSDRLVERMIRILLQYLSQFVAENQKDWDKWISMFLLAYRSSRHETTQNSPSMILMGTELRLPMDLLRGLAPNTPKVENEFIEETRGRIVKVHRFVRERMQICAEKTKTWYDSASKPISFMPGEKVWFFNPRRTKGKCPKVQSDWKGPYVVKDRLNELIYQIVRLPKSKPRVVHVVRKESYYTRCSVRDLYSD
nr:PREDICTED: uncharacterized protein LOC105663410 [Megachile rotundata]